jgi:hypothetical protein
MLNMLSMIRRGGLPWVLGVLILGGAGLAKAASEIGVWSTFRGGPRRSMEPARGGFFERGRVSRPGRP